MNQHIIVGNIGNIENKSTSSGRKVSIAKIATNRGISRDITDWHRVVFWGDLADQLISLYKKGDRIMVIGRVSTRKFTNSAGEKKWITETVAEHFSHPVKKTHPVTEPQDGPDPKFIAEDESFTEEEEE